MKNLTYKDKFILLNKFVNLNIPHNKKQFSRRDKWLISRYYNKLKPQGYFNDEYEGFILKDISRTNYKIKGSPKQKKIYVKVGTKIKDGKITTDTESKVYIKDGKIHVTRKGGLTRWQFSYNIAKDWTLEPFIKHLKKQIGKKQLKGKYFSIGAGIYDFPNSGTDKLEYMARKILQIASKYRQEYEDDESEKDVSDWLEYAYVYESREALEKYVNQPKKRKKKTRHAKTNRRN